MNDPARPRQFGRSIAALLAGIIVGAALSIGTDIFLNKIGLFPALGQPMSSALLAIATVYRTIYSVLSCYIIASLAPDRPMGHALTGGAIGFVFSIIGAVATWNRNFGPHWYPLALVVLAMPAAWLGGNLRVKQLRSPL